VEPGKAGQPGTAPRAPRRAATRPARHFAWSRWEFAGAEVAVAVLAGEVLPRLEHHLGWHLGISYDAGAAQAMLGAIAGGMITLTGFVLTAVTLIVQTVQSQSPRLLRVLDRTDRTPLLFGTFTATFTFALLVLGQVRADAVPGISVSLAMMLVLVSAGLFLRLLVTFRTTLTVGGLTKSMGDRVRELIDARYPVLLVPGPRDVTARVPDGDQFAWEVRHQGVPGIFQELDEHGAVRLAAATGTDIRVLPAIGDFLGTGARLAAGGGTAPDPAAVAALIRIGPVRTLEQDPAYGLRMLVDIAIRALSPAVNDPTSAVQALDQLDDILQRLVIRSLGDGLLTDDAGRVVVTFVAPRWEAFLSLAIDEILLFGAGSIQVTRRVRALLDDLLESAPAGRRPPVAERITTLERRIRHAVPDEALAAEAVRPDRQGIGSPRRDG
jgi:uncharacterized membrane protein